MSAQQRGTFDATSVSLFGVLIAATLLGALAVRTVTAEYATGMIRTTFSAMPARRLVLVAKAATVAAFVLPVALLIDIVGFELGQRIFASKHIQVALSHPGVSRAIIFGAAAASLVAIVGVGLGGLIRHTAGATTALTLIVVGGVTLGQLLPAGVRQSYSQTPPKRPSRCIARAACLPQARGSPSSASGPPSPSPQH